MYCIKSPGSSATQSTDFCNIRKVLFFDSFGRDPRDSTFPEIYKELLNRFKIFKYTKTRVQDFTSSTCGYYCVHFLYVLSLGLDFTFFMDEIGSRLYTESFIDLFEK